MTALDEGATFWVRSGPVQTPKERHMSPFEIHAHLQELARERVAAEAAGLTADPAYMAHLEAEVLEYRSALTGTVVTEIATLHGELFGRNFG
jgi:hypothetical protein